MSLQCLYKHLFWFLSCCRVILAAAVLHHQQGTKHTYIGVRDLGNFMLLDEAFLTFSLWEPLKHFSIDTASGIGGGFRLNSSKRTWQRWLDLWKDMFLFFCFTFIKNLMITDRWGFCMMSSLTRCRPPKTIIRHLIRFFFKRVTD